MLSRIAESLYWLGRYTERAEATARILDVYSHALLEDRVGGEESACRRLFESMGAAEPAALVEVGTSVESLVGFFVDDPRFAGSVVRSLEAMWENARGAREAMSSEMWASINATHSALDVRRGRSVYAQHGFLAWVRDRAAIVSGLADATMSHDDTWRFIVLGRSLERVDLTVRLLSTRLGDAWGSAGWVATLRCCAAYESYLRTYRRGVEGSKALEFLLLDRLFPRSVFHALGAAETVLFDLDPTSDRHGAGSEARRVVGRACADLEFVRVAELENGLPEHLARLERACAQAHDAAAKRFFNGAPRDPVERLMVWRLSIEHVTCYDYDGEVLASYNEARMSPARDTTQTVLDHRVDVRPSVPVLRYTDYWGTEVSAFDVHERHGRLVVAARSLVETVAPFSEVTDTEWEVLSDENVRDRFFEFLQESPHVPLDDAFVAVAAGIAADRTPRETVDAVSAWVRESLAYEPGATDVSTNARSALELGRGVCQDFVHVALAVLRAAGIPARYASGYLHPDIDATVDVAVTGQSHAWLEAWTGSWQRIDPTNGTEVGERHVLVARGRDYGDVAPLKGVYNGPPAHTSDVRVTIRRVA